MTGLRYKSFYDHQIIIIMSLIRLIVEERVRRRYTTIVWEAVLTTNEWVGSVQVESNLQAFNIKFH